MRSTFLVAVPVLAALVAMPAQGQVSARVHIDIPIGRRPPVTYAPQRQRLVIRDYDESEYGYWEDYYDEWIPETAYLYDGYYYDYPIVSYAQPIIVYRYRNQIFFAPRYREFTQWRQYRPYRAPGYYAHPRPSWDRRTVPSRPRSDDRYDGRPGNGNGNGRDGRDVRPVPQQGGRDGRGGRDMRPVPQQDGRNGNGNGRDMRPGSQQGGRDGRTAQPAPQQGGRDGRTAQPAPQQGGRGGGGARPAPQGNRGGGQAGGGNRSRARGG